MLDYRQELKQNLFALNNDSLQFEKLALEIFQYQYQHNLVYRAYVEHLERDVKAIGRIEKIPFLPIEFFKSKVVLSGEQKIQLVFESSGTTETQTSKHYISDLSLYEQLSRKTFESFYGSLTDYHIFALLPSYLERNNSSLVYMVQNFIFQSYSQMGGFYLDNPSEMVHNIMKAAEGNRKILLIGVSFALLALAENKDLSKKLKSISSKLTILETGGMKGRRKELVREELHKILKDGFGVSHIHSEYGMTELLSQSYSFGDGKFTLPPSMKIILREVNDPFSLLPSISIHKNTKQKTGGINIIDLANIDSCAFIETKDLAVFSPDYKSFEVLGRFDNSDIRGCNLLAN